MNHEQQALFFTPFRNGTKLRKIRVEFDGGTPCNNPRIGYGVGYGSYKIDGQPIVRMNHGLPMSANVAEMTTVICALRDVQIQFGNDVHVSIFGDSQIALLRCTKGLTEKRRRSFNNNSFSRSCDTLYSLCQQFSMVSTHWRGRAASVRLFGH